MIRLLAELVSLPVNVCSVLLAFYCVCKCVISWAILGVTVVGADCSAVMRVRLSLIFMASILDSE